MKNVTKFNSWGPPIELFKKVTNLLLVFLMTMSSYGLFASGGQHAEISFPFSEGTLKQVLEEVEKQADVKFIYLNKEIDVNKVVKVDDTSKTPIEILEQIFKENDISYIQKGNQIVLKSAEASVKSTRLILPEKKEVKEKPVIEEKKEPQTSFLQNTIKGTVTSSEDGEGLPGVSVLIQGTTEGTITDIDGNFSITAAPGETLVFSFIGFESTSIEVTSGMTSLNVSLDVDVQSLDEVVVIGYGTVRKRDLTGSVSSVDKNDITKIPTHNAMEAIQGRVAGVDITRSSGAAGAGVNIRIRGNRSITASNNPLYIIDGFQGGSINDINPNDIESIEVLKDASSTSIYGYQGANGVVIVTTKKGSSGKTKVSYNGYYGVNGLTEFPETRQGDDYVAMVREARIASGASPGTATSDFFSPAEWESISNEEWVDWVDLIMQNGKQQSHTLSVTGGSDKTKAFASIGYFNEESMYRGNTYDRYTVRLNLDHKINEWIKTGMLSQVTYYELDGRNDPISGAISAKPFGKVYDEFGDIIINPVIGEPNTMSPLADEIENYAVNNDINTSVNLNAYLEIEPIKGLSYRMNLGSRLYNGREGEFYYKDSYSRRVPRTTYSGVSTSSTRYYHWDNIINYTTEFGQHSIALTGVTNYVSNQNDGSSANGLGQQLTSQTFNNLGATTENFGVDSYYEAFETMSYALRINYSFAGKYLLTLSNRNDDASMLGEGRKGTFFPSAAIAWRIIDEPFLDGVNVLDDLKLRLSSGQVGNSNIRPYSTISGIDPATNMSFGEVPAAMYLFKKTLSNTNLQWEKSLNYNIGLDLGLVGGRIYLTADAYLTKTSDILLARPLPWSTGGRDLVIQQNVGETESKGVELLLNTVNFDNQNFTWKTTATFTYNVNKIVSLIDSTDIIVNERDSWLIGRPITSFFTYEKLGIWQTDEAEQAANLEFGNTPFEPGDIKLADLDGDSAITAEDRTFLGTPTPKYIVGLQNTFSFKGFDFGFYLVGRFGHLIDADHLARFDPSGKSGSLALYDYWTETNPSNEYPRPRNGVLFSIPGYQTLPIVNGSYVKLKTVSLGYTLPDKLMNRTPFERVKLYVTGSNLWVKSKNPLLADYDPENGGSGYPLNKQVVMGINLDF